MKTPDHDQMETAYPHLSFAAKRWNIIDTNPIEKKKFDIDLTIPDGDKCSISSLEFIDADNNENLIETICIHDKRLILFKCVSTGDRATINPRNEDVGILNSKKFTHVE